MFDIDNYFQDFMKNEKIFKDRDVLRPEFVPSNIFIFGKPGTGKTAVVNHVSERLNYQCRNSCIQESKWIFLNCQQVNTEYRILARICSELDPNDPIPIAGWPIDVIFDKLIEKLDSFVEGNCFLILDEIDILVKNQKNSHNILYNLARINSKLKKAKVNLIGISNVVNFKSFLDPRVLSSLGEEEIIFPAYNAMELAAILQQRAEIAFSLNALEEDVIPLCAALAAKEHGDARKALDLLRKAGELAERRNLLTVSNKQVYFAHDDIEKDKMQEYCEALPLQSKTILLSIYHMQKYRGDRTIITGDVYNAYSEIATMIPGLNKLTQRRVSELIRELDLSGMVNARVKSNGRYGRTKFIKLNIPLEDTSKYLMSENRLNEYINYRPICVQQQTTRLQGKKYKQIL